MISTFYILHFLHSVICNLFSGKLKNLTILKAEMNNLTEITPALSSCSSLVELYLSFNNIEANFPLLSLIFISFIIINYFLLVLLFLVLFFLFWIFFIFVYLKFFSFYHLVLVIFIHLMYCIWIEIAWMKYHRQYVNFNFTYMRTHKLKIDWIFYFF